VARPFRVAAVVVTLLLGFLACQRLAGLDRRFLTISSLSGAEGLAAYLLGDYAWAAEAYRRNGWPTRSTGRPWGRARSSPAISTPPTAMPARRSAQDGTSATGG